MIHSKEGTSVSTSKTVIYTLLISVAAVVVGGILYMYSGAFDVSAGWKDGPLTRWIVITTRERSIERRAEGIKAPVDLNDPKVLNEGYEHYREMCVGCHRAPGLKDSEIRKGLNPKPPNLSKSDVDEDPPGEIFWVIKNGIRMTAMPAWGVTHSDEKIWAMTAFVQKLPKMTAAQYQAYEKAAGPPSHDHDEDEDAGGAAGHTHMDEDAHEHEHTD
jgi:mono/diheme cytochrome c family protein